MGISKGPVPVHANASPDPRASNLRELLRAAGLAAGAAVAALQPPRLLLGTLAIAFIAVVGSVLDAIGGPTYLGGLEQPLTEQVEEERLQTMLAIRDGLPETIRATLIQSDQVTPSELRVGLMQWYLEERTGLDTDSERASLEQALRDALLRLESLEPQGTFTAIMSSAGTALGEFVGGVITLEPSKALKALARLIFEIPAQAFVEHPFITILLGLLLAFTAALFGGAIARLDALDTGLRRKPTAWIGLEYAWTHASTFLQTLLLPLAVVAVLAGLAAIVGIPFNLEYLDVIGSILYVIAVVFGLVATVLLIGYGILAPMLLGAVAVERADAGDSIQRAWGVLFNRPAHLAFVLAVALVAFGVCLAAVDLVAVVALKFAAASWGGIVSGNAVAEAGSIQLLDFTFQTIPNATTGSATAASALIGFWETLVVSIILGYVFSWFATLGSRLFLAMRELVDRQSISVVWVPGALPGSTVRIPEDEHDAFAAEDRFQEGPR